MKTQKKIAIIAGARPNFMKIAPLCRELKRRRLDFFVVNTGQHFTKSLAADICRELKIQTDYTLRPARRPVIRQMADIMRGLEMIFIREKPDLVLVVGDVNSTLAGALVANKMGIKLVHVEAGLRSHNRLMPEEFNRVVTDHLADYLLVTTEEGRANLKKEGLVQNVVCVGNLMIDSLVQHLPKKSPVSGRYYYCTLHRGENVDDKKIFSEILAALAVIAQDAKIYLPLHPRTKKMAQKFGLLARLKSICEVRPPASYRESLAWEKNAALILTDSGGVQEETSYLGVPCLTLRTETERPITVRQGTSVVAGVTKQSILRAYRQYLQKPKTGKRIPLWDGRAAQRIIDFLLSQ